jgi:hypothetical protein
VKLPSALTATLPWLGPVASAQVLPPSPEGGVVGGQGLSGQRAVFVGEEGVVDGDRQVVDGVDGQEGGGGGDIAIGIGQGVGEAVGAVVVGVRGVGEAAVGVDHDAAVAGSGGERPGVAAIPRGGVVGGQGLSGQRAVFVGEEGVVDGDRQVVDGVDGQEGGGGGDIAIGIGQGVGEAVGAVVVGVRGVGEAAVGVDHDAAVAGSGGECPGVAAIPRGGVVGGQGLSGQRAVFVGEEGVVDGDRQVVDGVDGQEGGGGGDIAIGIGQGVGEAVGAVVVGVRGVGEAAVGVDHDAAVAGSGGERPGVAAIPRGGVVGGQGLSGQRAVFVGEEGVVDGDRQVVDGVDGQEGGGGGDIAIGIGQGVGEAVGAVVVGVRGVGEAAVGVDHDAAVAGSGGECPGVAAIPRGGVVGGQGLSGQRAVFVGEEGVVDGDRQVVDGVDGQEGGGGGDIAIGIGQGVGEAVGAVVVGVRGVGEAAVGVDHDAAVAGSGGERPGVAAIPRGGVVGGQGLSGQRAVFVGEEGVVDGDRQVVDGVDGQEGGGGGDIAIGIGQGVGEAVGAVVVGVRGVGEAAVGVDHDAAVAGSGGERPGVAAIPRGGVVGGQGLSGQRAVFVGEEGVVDGDRQVVDGVDGQEGGGGGDIAIGIGQGVGEAVGAVVVGVRGVGEAAVGVDHDAAVAGSGGERPGVAAIPRGGVVGGQGLSGQRAVFVGEEGVVDGDRQVVDGVDGQEGGGGGDIAIGIGQGVGEAVGAVVVGVRGVGEAAVGVDHDAAVAGSGGERPGVAAIPRGGVVGGQGLSGQRAVFVGEEGVVDGDRQVVDGVDGQEGGGGGDIAIGIGQGVGEAVGAVVVGVRGVGEAAVGVDHDAAVAGSGGERPGVAAIPRGGVVGGQGLWSARCLRR